MAIFNEEGDDYMYKLLGTILLGATLVLGACGGGDDSGSKDDTAKTASKTSENVNNSENKANMVELEDAKPGDKAVDPNDKNEAGYYKVVKVTEPNEDISSGSIKATLNKVILAEFYPYEGMDDTDLFDVDDFPIKTAISVIDAENTSEDDNFFAPFGADVRTDDNKAYESQVMLNTSENDGDFKGKVSDHFVTPVNMKDVDLKNLDYLKFTFDASMDGKESTAEVKFE